MSKKWMKVFIVFAFITAFSFSGTLAFADVIFPEHEACDDLDEGDECEMEDGTMGTCQEGQRCYNDYNEMGEDGPGTTCEPTLECKSAPNDNDDDTDGEAMEDEPDGGCSSINGNSDSIPVLSFVVGLVLLGMVRRKSKE